MQMIYDNERPLLVQIPFHAMSNSTALKTNAKELIQKTRLTQLPVVLSVKTPHAES